VLPRFSSEPSNGPKPNLLGGTETEPDLGLGSRFREKGEPRGMHMNRFEPPLPAIGLGFNEAAPLKADLMAVSTP
jgi:hypothetical protein